MKKLKRILGCALALIFFIETSVSPVVAVRDVPQGEFVVSEEAVQAASEAKEPSVEETSEEMAVTAEPPEETAAQKEEVSAEKAELTEEAAAEILTADTETAVTEKAVEAAVAEEDEIAIKEAAAEKADDTALGADAGDNVPKIHYATASTYKIYEGEAPDPAADEPLVNGVLNWLPEGNILTLIPEEGCSITEVTVTDENGLIVAATSSIVEKEPAAEDEGSAEEPAEESAEESNEESAEEGSGTVTASADMETGIYTLKFSDHGEDFSGNFTVSVKAGKDCVYVGELVGPKTEQDTRDGSLNYPWKFMEDAYSDVRDGGIIYVVGTANVTSGTREGWPDIQKDVTIKGYPAVLRGGTAPAAPTLNITVSSVLCGDTVFAGYDPDEDGTIHDPMYGDIVTAYPLNITGNGNIYTDSHRLQVGRLRADTAAEGGTEPETKLVPLNDVTVGSSIYFNISPKESGTEEKPAKVDVHLYGTTALNLTHDAGSVLYESIAIERVGGTLNDYHPTSVEYKDRGLLPVLIAGSGDVNFTAKDLTGGDFYLLSGTEAAEFNVNMTLENCKGSPKLGNLNTTGEVLVSVKDSSLSSFYTTYNSLTAKKVTYDLVGSSIGELRHYGPSFDNWTNLSRGYQSFTDGVVFNMTDSTITTLYEATTTEGTDFTKPSVTVNLRSAEGKNCSFGNIYSNTGDRWKFNLLEGAAILGNGRFITADVEAKAGTALTMGNQSRLAALHDVTLEDNATLKFVGAEYWISGDLTGGTLENSTLEVPKRFDLGVKGNIGGSIRTKITGVTGTAGAGSTGVLVNIGASSVAGFLTYGGSVGDEGLAALGSASSRTYISASQVPAAESDAVYVRYSGSDTNDGTSYENAAATTKRAYELAAATGRNFIVVCGNVPYYFDGTGYGDYTWEMFGGAENAGSVTITSSHGTNYRSDFFKGMLSPAGVRGGSSTEVMTNAYGEDAVTTFKDINFNYYNNTDSAWSQTTSFFANGHRTVMDTGVSISLGTNLYAGANGVDLPHGTDLTVNSGSYNNIYGGSNGAKRIEGDAVLTVNSCSVSSQIIGGGVNGTNTITGNVLLTVNGVSLSGGNNAYRIYGTNSDNVTGDVTVKVGCGTGKVTGFSCLRGAYSGKAGGDVTVEVNGDNTSFRTSAASDSYVDAIIANEATLTGKVDLYVHGGKGDPRLAIIAGGKGTIRVEDVKSVGSIMGYFSGSTADSPVDITVTSDLVKESGAAEQTVVYRGIYAGAGDVNSSRQAVSDSAGSVPAAGKKIASAGTVTLNNVEATVVCGGMNGWRYPVADITDRNLILSGTNRISTSLRQFTGVSLSRLDGQPVTELSYSGTQLECSDLLNKGILTFTQGAAVTGNYTGAENAALRVAAEPVTFTKKLGGHTALEPVIPASGCQVISLPYAAGDVPEGKETFQAVGITFATGVPEGGATWEVRPRLFPKRKNVFVRDSLGESESYPYDEHDGSDYDHAVRSLAEAFVLADTETDGEANIIVCGELSQENNWNATENSGTVNITGVYVAAFSTYDYRKDGAALHLTGSTGGFLTMNGNWTVKNLPIVYDANADLGIDADGHTLIFGTDICPDIVVDKTEGARRYVNGRWETVDAPVPAQAADVTVKTSTGGAPTRFYIIGGGRTNKNPQNIDIRLYNTKVGRVIGMYDGTTVGSGEAPGSFRMVLRDTEVCGFSTYNGTYPAASLCAPVGIANNVRGGTGTINGDARCDLEVYSKAAGTLPMLTHTYSVTCTGNGIKAHVNKTKAAAPTSNQYDGFAKCSGDYYELYDGLDNGSYGFSTSYYTMEDYTRTCPENVTLTMLGGFRITSGLFWKYAYEHATEDRRNPVSAETTDLTVNFGNAERGSFVTVSQFLYNYDSRYTSYSNNPAGYHGVNIHVYPGTALGGSTASFTLDNYTFSPYASETYAAKDLAHGYPNLILHGRESGEEPYTYTLNTFRKFAVTADDCVVKIGDPSYICSYAAAVNNGVIDFGGKKLTIGKSAAGYGGDLTLKDGGSVTNYLKTQTAEVAGTVTVDNATLLCDAEKLSFGKYTASGDAKMLVNANTSIVIGNLLSGCEPTVVDFIPEMVPQTGDIGSTVSVQRGLKPEGLFVTGKAKMGEGDDLGPFSYDTKDDEIIIGHDCIFENRYRVVEYLENHGEEYIDTDLVTDKYAIDLDIVFVGNFINKFVFGYNIDVGDKVYDRKYLGFNAGGKFTFGYGKGTTNYYQIENPLQLNTKYNIKASYISPSKTIVIENNGKTIINFSKNDSTKSDPINIYLMGANNGAAPGFFRLYNCRINGEQNELVRDFVPVVDMQTGEYGLYDTVEGRFYGNASGKGAFTGGAEIYMLPEEYTQVEYIESHGAEYIDTDLIPNNTTGIKTKFSQSELGANFVSGCVSADGQWKNRFYPWYLSENNVYYGYDGYYGSPFPVTKNKIYEGTLNYNNDKKAIFEKKVIATLPNDYISSGYSIYLFATNTGTSVTQFHIGCRIYDFKMTQDQSFVRNFVPVFNSRKNEYGLYDVVEGKFYGNSSGNGAFTGGPEVSHEDIYIRIPGYTTWKLGGGAMGQKYVVYLKDDGNDTNSGGSMSDSVKTLGRAFDEANKRYNGQSADSSLNLDDADRSSRPTFYITVCGTFALQDLEGAYSSSYSHPLYDIVFTQENLASSKQMVKINTTSVDLPADMTIQGIRFRSNVTEAEIFFGGHTVKIGAQVFTNNSKSRRISLYAGANTADVACTDLTVESGSWWRVYGGGNTGAVTGDTNLILGPESGYIPPHGESRLPEGYTEVEYIKSANQAKDIRETNDCAYINTDFIPSLTTKLEVKMSFDTFSSGEDLNGASYSGRFAWGHAGSVTRANFYFGLRNKNLDSGIKLDENVHIFGIDANTSTCWVDDKVIYFGELDGSTSTGPLFLFARNFSPVSGANKPIDATMYYCRIWDSGELIRDFVPAVRNGDMVYGLFDLVEGLFYPSAGSIGFGGGEPVEPTGRYAVVEYIESYGQQCIDPDLRVSQIKTVECLLMPTGYNLTGHTHFLSGRQFVASGYKQYVSFTSTDVPGKTTFFTGLSSSTSSKSRVTWDTVNRPLNQLYEIESTNISGMQELTVNGDVIINTAKTSSDTIDFKAYLCVWSAAGVPSVSTDNYRGRIYYTKLYGNDDSLIRDLVPVLDTETGEYGLYDKTEGLFYGNISSGAFTGGELTGEYADVDGSYYAYSPLVIGGQLSDSGAEQDDSVTGVIGGGYSGAVSGDVNITVRHGDKYGYIVGGGVKQAASVGGNTKITVDGDAVAQRIYGGGLHGPVSGNTEVDLNRCTVDRVYGGGLYGESGVGGSTAVNLSSPSVEGEKPAVTVKQYARGSGAQSGVAGTSVLNVYDGAWLPQGCDVCAGGYTGEANVSKLNIQGGLIDTDIFAGSAGEYKYNEKQEIIGVDTTVGKIGYSYLTMSGGTVTGNVFGGGNKGYVGVENATTEETAAPRTTVTISGGEVTGNVYGGCNVAATWGNIAVNVPDGSVAAVTGKMFAGGRGNTSLNLAAKVEGVANITVSGGTVQGDEEAQIAGGIYGGCDASGTVKKSVVTAEAVQECSYFGGGYGALTEVKDANLKLDADGTSGAYAVYGGGELGTAGKTKVTAEKWNGTVYGGGKGAVEGSTVTDAAVETTNVSVTGTVAGNVYGGGEMASVSKGAEVTVEGTVAGSVYGGGKGLTDTECAGAPLTEVTVNGTVDGCVYGGGELASVGTVGSTAVVTTVDVATASTVTRNVYGGGKGASGTVKAAINGNTAVSVAGTVSGNDSSVFGGGEIAPVNGSTYVKAYDGCLVDAVYGGNDVEGAVSGKTDVDIESGTVTDVYGGGRDAAYEGTGTDVDITGGTVTNAYGGGKGTTASVNKADICVTGGKTGTVYGGGNAATVTGNTKVTVNTTDDSQHVDRVFGGNNKADMAIQPAFDLADGKVGEVYCGGNEGLMTKADGLAFTFDYPNIEVGALYAGCNNTGAKSTNDADTTLTMKTGTYGDVYGGNNVSGAMAQTGVTVAEPAEGGLTITNVYGGGNVALAPVTNVVIDSYSRKEGKPVTVYGGGNQAVAQKASVTVNGGSPDTVYAGGNEGSCNEAVLSLKGGDILTVYGGGNAATVTEKTTVTANADSGKTLTVADFYCGNNQAAMNIQPAVTLEDVKITSFYGGGNQGEMTYPTGLSYTFGSEKTEIETVYGGGNQAGVTNGVTLTVEAGGINTVYGGSNQTGDVSRTTVNVKNDIKGSVYGGGRGSNTKVVDAAVNVTGGTIGTQDGSGVQGGSVYGGSGFGSVKETRVNVQDTDGKVTVLGSVYGAGYGLSSHAETTSVNVDLTLAIATGNTSGSNIGSAESCDLLVKETAAAGSDEDGESEVSAERKSTFAGRSYINGNVYGGGDMGQVGVGYINTGNDTATVETKGTTRVTVKSGYVNGSVFGGGNGQPTGVDEQGNPNTYTSYMGAVFGTCSMNVEGGCVNGSVYGCGLQSKTYADYGSADHTAARVTVSTVPTENTKAIVIGGSIFGGGNKGNGDSLNASIPTVYGDTNVEVSGTENSYTHIYMLSNAGTNQGGGIYGDGNLCLVSGKRHVLIQNFSCGVGKDAKLLKTFYSLQRANEVDMISSRVVLKGAIDLVDEHPSDDRYSVNRVGEIHMKQNSTMKVVQLVNQLGGLTSDQDLDRKFIWLGKNTNNAGNGNELLDNGYTAHGALATDPNAPISPAEVTAYRTAYENYADHGSTESTQFTSINTVCVANGGYLEIMKGENEYGNVNGLFTLQLLKANPGEGGGFVYADITESTGNFVCVTKAAPVEGQEDQYMFVYHNVGGKVTGEKLEYYYWYLKGGKYGYSVDLKGVLGTTETTFDSKVALTMDQAPSSDPAKDFSSYYYVLSKLSMGSVTELQKNYMYRILRNGWDEAADADSEHLAIELVTTKNSRQGGGMVTETKSIGYLGYKTVGGTPQGEADETSGAREWGLWVKSSESPAVWTFLPSHHGQTDYTFTGADTIPLDLIELNCVSATLTFVMHKGVGVVEEFRDIPYNIEIVEAEKKTFDRGDVDMHADACTKVDIGLHVSVVRLVPTQAAYISAGRLYAGVPATTEFTATRDSAFTAQFITKYVPSSYNTASQNNITEMVVTRYNETYLLVTEGHLKGIGFTLAGDPGEGGLCTIKRVANAEDVAPDHYTITYKTVAGAGKYEIRYNSGDSTKCQAKCHKASSDNELSVYGSDTSPLKGYRFIVKNFAEGGYEVTEVIKTETGVPKDVPAYYTITKDEGEGDSYTVHYDPSDVAEIPDDSETGGAHVKHLKDGFGLPRGTAVSLIISMDEGAPTYWYYYCDDAAQTSEIPLSKFNRMNRKDSETELQNDNAAMEVRSAASTRITENLIFVFDFANVTDDDWTAAGYDKEAVKEMDGTVLLRHEFRPQGSGFSYDVMDFIQETKDETASTFAHGTPAPSDPFRLKVRDAVQDFKVTLDRDTYYCHDTMQAKLMLNANTDVTNTRYDERTFAAKVSLRDESGNVVPFPEGTVITYKGAELSLEKKNLSVIVPIKVYGSHEITISNQMQGFEAGNFGLKAELYTTSADGYYNSIPIRNDVDTMAAFTVEEDPSTSLKVVTDEDVTGSDKRNHLRKPGQSIALNVTAVGGVPEDRVDVTLYTYVEAGSESGYVPVPLENVLTEKPELATGVNTWQSPVAETAGTGIYRLQFNYLDRTEYWDFLVY